MVSCKEVTELITDYLEGRLSFWQRVRFQMHIGMCRHCRAYLKQMRTTVGALSRLPEEPVPEDVRDELMKRFKDWKK